jgi:hypothetical protein
VSRRREATAGAPHCRHHPTPAGGAGPAPPCRCGAARATQLRAGANRFGLNQGEAALPAEAHRQPIFPAAKVLAPISFGSVLIIASIHRLISSSAACGIHNVRSLARRLAPNSPVRRADQDRLVGPDVEPDLGLAPTWKAPWRNADLAPFTKLQIAIFRCKLDR